MAVLSRLVLICRCPCAKCQRKWRDTALAFFLLLLCPQHENGVLQWPYVSVVRPSARISQKPQCLNFTKFLIHVSCRVCRCGRVSVLFWWRCDTLCTSGFVDDVTFAGNRPGKGDANTAYTQWLTKGQHGFDIAARTQVDSPGGITWDKYVVLSTAAMHIAPSLELTMGQRNDLSIR